MNCREYIKGRIEQQLIVWRNSTRGLLFLFFFFLFISWLERGNNDKIRFLPFLGTIWFLLFSFDSSYPLPPRHIAPITPSDWFSPGKVGRTQTPERAFGNLIQFFISGFRKHFFLWGGGGIEGVNEKKPFQRIKKDSHLQLITWLKSYSRLTPLKWFANGVNDAEQR